MIGLSMLVSIVLAEGYWCPYPDIGYDGVNDVVYDYYDTNDGGATWLRLGEVGWVPLVSYCEAKGNPELHFDAGEAKCIDSVGKCSWDGSACVPNPSAVPDCVELCQAILNNEGLPCLGEGCGSREEIYAICDNVSPPQPPVEPTDPVEPPAESSQPAEPTVVLGFCAKLQQ